MEYYDLTKSEYHDAVVQNDLQRYEGPRPLRWHIDYLKGYYNYLLSIKDNKPITFTIATQHYSPVTRISVHDSNFQLIFNDVWDETTDFMPLYMEFIKSQIEKLEKKYEEIIDNLPNLDGNNSLCRT